MGADAARETNNKCQIKRIQLIFIKDIFLTSFTKIMGNLFGKEKKSPSRINDQDRAVLELKKQRDQLHKYQKRIELSLEKDRTLAKKLLSEGKKDRAKLLLRKKKFHEGLLAKTDGQLDNLERLVHDLEFAQIEQQVLDGLKVGNEALKKANEMFSIGEIEQIMDDTSEAVEKQNEISAILSGQLSQEDEDDVLKELDDLIGSEENISELPEVPTNEPIPNPEVEKPTKEKSKKIALEAS